MEIGDNYETTALKETYEETGVLIEAIDLIPVAKYHRQAHDEINKKINNAFQLDYVHIYNGKIEDLKIEEGKSIGFEAYPFQELLDMDEIEKRKFINYNIQFVVSTLIEFIEKNKIIK